MKPQSCFRLIRLRFLTWKVWENHCCDFFPFTALPVTLSIRKNIWSATLNLKPRSDSMSPKWWWFRLGSFFSRSFPFKVQCSFLLVVGCKTLPEKNYAADFSLWAFGLSSVLFFWSHRIWDKLVQNDKKRWKPTWCCFDGTKPWGGVKLVPTCQ